MKRVFSLLSSSLGLVLSAVFLLALPATARAQSAGNVILTQTPIPRDLNGRDLQKFLRRNKVSTLKRAPGSKQWKAYASARLRRKPSVSLLNLPDNAGKLHLAFYVKNKRRWQYVNVMDINYQPPAKLIQFEVIIPDDFGLTPGKTYQLRVTLLNARKKEVLLARTTLKLK